MNRHPGFAVSSLLAFLGAFVFAMAVATASHARSLPRSAGVMDRGSSFTIPTQEQASIHRSSELAASDRHFLAQALRNSEKEVTILKLAMQRGADAEVRKMAERLIEERARADEELRRLARIYAIPASDRGGAERGGSAGLLQTLSGGHFDRAWLEQMILTHRRTIELFERSVRQSQDNRIRTFATATLPTLQKNLSLLKSALPPESRRVQTARS